MELVSHCSQDDGNFNDDERWWTEEMIPSAGSLDVVVGL